VPPGEFLTGAIHLRSNVNLHLHTGATIRFSRDPKAYPIVFTRFEGTELMSFSPLLYAFEQENIAITGQGTLDGNAAPDVWWNWAHPTTGTLRLDAADRKALTQMAEEGVPVGKRVFGPGHYLRPQFIQPYRCKNVLIEGVSLRNSPMWQVTPALCANVIVRGLDIAADGPNTDGCDPESCRDVLIDHCTFNTGDDCIAIKSGRNADGRRVPVPSENIIVRDCHMKNGHGGVTIGSEISAGVRRVFVERNVMESPQLDIGIRVKNNAMRGGMIEGLYVRDCEIRQAAKAALAIDFNYEEAANGPFKPIVRDVQLTRVRAGSVDYALYLRGFANAPIEDIRLTDCTFGHAFSDNLLENVRNLQLRNVTINGKSADALSHA
jgi:polygalacturonase